jgi:hypothetical protein
MKKKKEIVVIALLEWKEKVIEDSICLLDNRHSQISWLFLSLLFKKSFNEFSYLT